jgi:hypothetical protein
MVLTALPSSVPEIQVPQTTETDQCHLYNDTKQATVWTKQLKLSRIGKPTSLKIARKSSQKVGADAQ